MVASIISDNSFFKMRALYHYKELTNCLVDSSTIHLQLSFAILIASYFPDSFSHPVSIWRYVEFHTAPSYFQRCNNSNIHQHKIKTGNKLRIRLIAHNVDYIYYNIVFIIFLDFLTIVWLQGFWAIICYNNRTVCTWWWRYYFQRVIVFSIYIELILFLVIEPVPASRSIHHTNVKCLMELSYFHTS